jgi:hypothetical protein
LGISLSDRWPRLEACAAGRLRVERDAREGLERALERLRRESGSAGALTLSELIDEYLAQHDAEPETIEKLRWLLTKAVQVIGARRLRELRSQEIAAWRMTIPPGHRFEATQALRQVLARVVVWGMIDVNRPSKGSTTRSAGALRSGVRVVG